MLCESGDEDDARPVLRRSLYDATIEAVSRYVVRRMNDVDNHERLDPSEHLLSMSFLPRRGAAIKKSKRGVCSESSRDSLWPVDDDEPPEEVSDASEPPVSVQHQVERGSKFTANALVEAMRRHRSEWNLREDDTTREFVESRCRLELSRIDVVVEALLGRAAQDDRLPTELREILPTLRVYSYDVEYEIDERGNTWSVELSLDHRSVLRNYRLAHGSNECLEAYRARVFDEDSPRIDVFQMWNPECAPEKAREIEGALAVSVKKAVWKRRSLRFTEARTFELYLMLHTIAKWQDVRELLIKPDREYFAMLTLMFHRYPVNA